MYSYRAWFLRAMIPALLLGLAVYVIGAQASPAFMPGTSGAEGQGAAPAPKYTFAQDIEVRALRQGSKTSGYTYQLLADDEDVIKVRVPTAWSEFDTNVWVYQGQQVGTFAAAASSLETFYGLHSAPGVFIGVSYTLAQQYDQDALLDLERPVFSGRCAYAGRFDYADAFYAGHYDAYVDCAEGGHSVLVAAVGPADRAFLSLIRMTIESRADLEAAATILQTVQITDHLNGDH